MAYFETGRNAYKEEKISSEYQYTFTQTDFNHEIQTTFTADSLKIKFYLNSIMISGEGSNVYTNRVYNVGRFFELDNQQEARIFTTEGFFDFTYGCVKTPDIDGLFNYYIIPADERVTLFVSDVSFVDSFYDSTNDWNNNADYPDGIVPRTEYPIIGRDQWKLVGQDNTLSFTTILSDFVAVDSIKDTLKIKFFLEAYSVENDTIESGVEYYTVGKWFEVENHQQITFGNLRNSYQMSFEIDENEGNNTLGFNLSISGGDVTVYISSITFEDSYYDSTDGWLNPDNPDGLSQLVRKEDPIKSRDQWVHENKAVEFTGDLNSSITTNSTAEKLKIKFFMDAFLNENGAYYVGKWFELEDLQNATFGNSLVQYNLVFTCASNDGEGVFEYTLTTDEDVALYISAITFEDSDYDSSDGWSNPDNPANIIESIQPNPAPYQPFMKSKRSQDQQIEIGTDGGTPIETTVNMSITRIDNMIKYSFRMAIDNAWTTPVFDDNIFDNIHNDSDFIPYKYDVEYNRTSNGTDGGCANALRAFSYVDFSINPPFKNNVGANGCSLTILSEMFDGSIWDEDEDVEVVNMVFSITGAELTTWYTSVEEGVNRSNLVIDTPWMRAKYEAGTTDEIVWGDEEEDTNFHTQPRITGS